MFILVINSTNLVEDGQNNKFVYKFPNSVVLKNKYIAVVSISMYYSWFNISQALGNNVFTYTWTSGTTTTTYTITIPDGLYEISDLNNLIQFECLKNGTYYYNPVATPQMNYYPFELLLNANRYAVQLNTYKIPTTALLPVGFVAGPAGLPTVAQNSVVTFPAKFSSLVGYSAGFQSNSNNPTFVPPSPPSKASNYAAINGAGTISYLSNTSPQLQPNSNVLFSLSNVNNPYCQPSSIIYSLNPTVNVGEQIIERPPNFIWTKMIEGTYNQLNLNLLGSDLQPLQILDNNMTVLLAIRDADEAYLGGK